MPARKSTAKFLLMNELCDNSDEFLLMNELCDNSVKLNELCQRTSQRRRRPDPFKFNQVVVLGPKQVRINHFHLRSRIKKRHTKRSPFCYSHNEELEAL